MKITSEAIENSIVDKLGEKGVKWEKDGFTSQSKKWITFEEIHDATTYQTFTKRKGHLELNWEQEHLKEGRYTLDMVKNRP